MIATAGGGVLDVDLGEALGRSLAVLLRGQLPTGEIGTYFRRHGRGLAYLRSPLPSTFVHDALACFDPGSAWVETALFDLVPAASRPGFLRAVNRLRRRIRRFIAWDESCDGTWRFFGRTCGVAPSADVTACAAAVLLDSRRRTARRPWERHVAALARLAPTEAPPDLAAAANVLRFLALVGEDVGGRIDALLHAAARRRPGGPQAHYASPMAVAYCLARAWSQAHLPRRDELAARLLPWVIERQQDDGGFGGPLSTAFGLTLLLDLDHRGPQAGRARAALLRCIGAWGGWPYEAFLADDGGSLACSTAVAMAALARAETAGAGGR
jgi:hypothetical protein